MIAPKSEQSMTELELFLRAKKRAEYFVSGQDYAPMSEDDAFIMLDDIVSTHPIDEDGRPIFKHTVESLAYSHVLNNFTLEKPQPTLEDARRLYIKERIKDTHNEIANMQRLDRVISAMCAVVKLDTPLVDIRRDTARAITEEMRADKKKKVSTINRYLHDFNALMNLAIVEFELNTSNPFNRLTLRSEGNGMNEREPFSDVLLSEINKRMSKHARDDLKNIWVILANTGCRLGEITGLLVSDVMLAEDIPHISLQFHPHRRLKTQGSIRNVPLVGDALKAAQDAIMDAGTSPYLFPRYGRKRGSDSASQALMKHVRVVTLNPKLTVHSLRHTMEEQMTTVGIEEFDRNLILGHSKGSMSERYGGKKSRLIVAERALKKALDLEP